jgi:hypothetical protein
MLILASQYQNLRSHSWTLCGGENPGFTPGWFRVNPGLILDFSSMNCSRDNTLDLIHNIRWLSCNTFLRQLLNLFTACKLKKWCYTVCQYSISKEPTPPHPPPQFCVSLSVPKPPADPQLGNIVFFSLRKIFPQKISQSKKCLKPAGGREGGVRCAC